MTLNKSIQMWIDDLVLSKVDKPITVEMWQPQEVYVVAGNSNDVARECQVERCLQDGVPVLKRKGGGGAVVLHPQCLVIGTGLWVKNYYRNDFYFRELNAALISLLASLNPIFCDLYQDGISDVVFGGKKIAGTSLFRSRNYLLYQASILLECGADLMGAYLHHPSKEPAYRGGKSHENFVTSLTSIVPSFQLPAIDSLREVYLGFLQQRLAEELIAPQETQVAHLARR